MEQKDISKAVPKIYVSLNYTSTAPEEGITAQRTGPTVLYQHHVCDINCGLCRGERH